MEIVPHGTIDPTPFMYDKALYAMAAMQVAALMSNIALKPVSPEQIRKLSHSAKKSTNTAGSSKGDDDTGTLGNSSSRS
jgi:hypothetical protein